METRTVTDNDGNQFEAFVTPISCAKCGMSGEVVTDKQLAEESGDPDGYVQAMVRLMTDDCCANAPS